jgi:hypothetical protein
MRLIENIESHPDREFLEIVERIVARRAEKFGLQEIFLIEIRNWFDQKWLGYSGKALVQNPFSAAFQGVPGAEKLLKSVPAIFRKLPLTVPPFTPPRIIRERYFRRAEEGQFVAVGRSKPVHPYERQSSSTNLHRTVRNISDSAIFAWYSSNATKNSAASLMVYITKGTKSSASFRAFRKNPQWKLIATRGINSVVRKSKPSRARAANRPAAPRGRDRGHCS